MLSYRNLMKKLINLTLIKKNTAMIDFRKQPLFLRPVFYSNTKI